MAHTFRVLRTKAGDSGIELRVWRSLHTSEPLTGDEVLALLKAEAVTLDVVSLAGEPAEQDTPTDVPF